jgi:hypothetical protein
MELRYNIILSVLIAGFLTTGLLSDEKINYKIYKCEKICKERYETCSLKASIKRGKEKNKVAAICDNRLFDCRERCRKIK